MIKLFVTDVDGTLTDGCINISENGEIFKSFNVKDGYGLSLLIKRKCCYTCIITSRESQICLYRAKEVNISYVLQGVSSKINVLKQLAKELNIEPGEIAYIGDDLNDLECIKFAGVSACPNDSHELIKSHATYICSKNGGAGCVREFIDFLNREGMINNYDL